MEVRNEDKKVFKEMNIFERDFVQVSARSDQINDVDLRFNKTNKTTQL